METLELIRFGNSDMNGGIYQDKDGKLYADCHNEVNNDGVSTVWVLSPSDEPDGDPSHPITCQIKILNPLTESEKKQKQYKTNYMLLSRLQSDAVGYFGETGIYDKDKWDCRYHCEAHIWGKNIKKVIEEMKKQWSIIPSDIKPTWCTLEQIQELERKTNETIPYLDFLDSCRAIARELETELEIKEYSCYDWTSITFMTDRFGGIYVHLHYDLKTDKVVNWFGCEQAQEIDTSNISALTEFIRAERDKELAVRDFEGLNEMINSQNES